MTSRKLVLKRERLAALTTAELGQVVGGSHVACPTHGFSCDDCPIPTLPVNECVVVSGTSCLVSTCVC